MEGSAANGGEAQAVLHSTLLPDLLFSKITQSTFPTDQ